MYETQESDEDTSNRNPNKLAFNPLWLYSLRREHEHMYISGIPIDIIVWQPYIYWGT